MPESTPNTFQKQFIRYALLRLPHHIALYLAVKMRSRHMVNMLDGYAKRHIIRANRLQSFGRNEQKRYKAIANRAALWHGTGRYQHGNGKTQDVLESILATGSIQPTDDAYAIFSGGKLMRSTSLTRLRIIARCYGDMHGQGYLEPNRYGDALTWTSYHYGLFYARLYTVYYGKIKRYYKTWHKLTHDENGHNTWGKKVNQHAQDVWDVFGLGSDIPGNFPIIFGITQLTQTLPLSSVFRDYEVRVDREIRLRDITHIEVPAAKVRDVEMLLAKYSIAIPVEPIELGEQIASQTPFSQLLKIGG